MIYVLKPGVILIPDGRLGIQNGSQYCQNLYGFQSQLHNNPFHSVSFNIKINIY